MKTNYVIYDNNFEETDIIFDNEESAKFFVKLNSKQFAEYHIKKQFVYESFKDYLKHNRFKIAEMLNKLANKIIEGEIRFDLEFKNGVATASYGDIKYMAEKKRIILSSMWDKNTNKPIKFEYDEINVVVKKYNELEEKIKTYKKLSQELSSADYLEYDKKVQDVLDMEL